MSPPAVLVRRQPFIGPVGQGCRMGCQLHVNFAWSSWGQRPEVFPDRFKYAPSDFILKESPTTVCRQRAVLTGQIDEEARLLFVVCRPGTPFDASGLLSDRTMASPDHGEPASPELAPRPYRRVADERVLPVRRVLANLDSQARAKSFCTFLTFYCTLVVLTVLRIDFVRRATHDGRLAPCPSQRQTHQRAKPACPCPVCAADGERNHLMGRRRPQGCGRGPARQADGLPQHRRLPRQRPAEGAAGAAKGLPQVRTGRGPRTSSARNDMNRPLRGEGPSARAPPPSFFRSQLQCWDHRQQARHHESGAGRLHLQRL